MIDITHKSTTLRVAIAEATLKVSSDKTIEAIQQDTVPKGNVFEMSKAAGLLGVKNTPLILPDCHPLPIESTRINYEIDGLEIKIRMEVKTIYKTGVEVEAMHGASVVALNMYDMLKPIDKGIEIQNIRLVSKTGGKSDLKSNQAYSIHLVICSDRASIGTYEDQTGPALTHFFKDRLEKVTSEIIPDNADQILQALENQADIILFAGGTGYGDKDYTFDTLKEIVDFRIKGAEEKIRDYGNERTPFAMLSQSLVGIKNQQLIIAVPGSPKGALESVHAIFPFILHVFDVIKGKNHEND